jgi:hypothetical protein
MKTGILLGLYISLLLNGLANAQTPYGEIKLNLDPPPVVEGLHKSKVTLNVKEVDLSQNAVAFRNFISEGYEDTKIYLLELTSDEPYWLDYSSSMGADSRAMLVKWIETTLIKNYTEGEELGAIVESDSLLTAFFNGATKDSLQKGVASLSNFIGELLGENSERASIDRKFYSASTKICPFSQRFFSFIIVDPEPFHGPDKKTYLIVIESIYEE